MLRHLSKVAAFSRIECYLMTCTAAVSLAKCVEQISLRYTSSHNTTYYKLVSCNDHGAGDDDDYYYCDDYVGDRSRSGKVGERDTDL